MNYLQKIAKDSGKDWVDFESEILRVVKKVEKEEMYKSVKSFFSQTIKQRKTIDKDENKLVEFRKMMERINLKDKKQPDFFDLRNELVEDLNELQLLLDKYLGYVLSKSEISPLDNIKQFKPDAVLSFNYTDTYRKVYDQEGKIKYDYIHGEITEFGQNPEGRIVLGINEYLDDKEKNNCLEYIEFRKYFQRIFKGTGSEYKDWLDEINQKTEENYQRKESLRGKRPQFVSEMESYPETNQVIFYGHSLDVTDKDILSEIILTENVRCQFYYHDKTSLRSQITNLVKIIGQDELIKRTGDLMREFNFAKYRKAKFPRDLLRCVELPKVINMTKKVYDLNKYS